ncbi:MAG: chemotaxis protein CheW [Chitinivibrionia bacterium]|nr:chemotaxis protein CheW [Chitinivibrionia bacterium]
MSERKKVSPEALVGKYLTFVLGDGEYAIGILEVQQIIQMQPITRIPQAPGFIRGVINRRGKVIPILSIHNKFNMPSLDETNKTCIVIVEIPDKDGHLVFGIIIDEVKDVMQIDVEMLTQSLPEVENSSTAKHVVGAVRVGDKVRFILDLNEILDFEEVSLLKKVF